MSYHWIQILIRIPLHHFWERSCWQLTEPNDHFFWRTYSVSHFKRKIKLCKFWHRILVQKYRNLWLMDELRIECFPLSRRPNELSIWERLVLNRQIPRQIQISFILVRHKLEVSACHFFGRVYVDQQLHYLRLMSLLERVIDSNQFLRLGLCLLLICYSKSVFK